MRIPSWRASHWRLLKCAAVASLYLLPSYSCCGIKNKQKKRLLWFIYSFFAKSSRLYHSPPLEATFLCLLLHVCSLKLGKNKSVQLGSTRCNLFWSDAECLLFVYLLFCVSDNCAIFVCWAVIFYAALMLLLLLLCWGKQVTSITGNIFLPSPSLFIYLFT